MSERSAKLSKNQELVPKPERRIALTLFGLLVLLGLWLSITALWAGSNAWILGRLFILTSTPFIWYFATPRARCKRGYSDPSASLSLFNKRFGKTVGTALLISGVGSTSIFFWSQQLYGGLRRGNWEPYTLLDLFLSVKWISPEWFRSPPDWVGLHAIFKGSDGGTLLFVAVVWLGLAFLSESIGQPASSDEHT